MWVIYTSKLPVTNITKEWINLLWLSWANFWTSKNLIDVLCQFDSRFTWKHPFCSLCFICWDVIFLFITHEVYSKFHWWDIKPLQKPVQKDFITTLIQTSKQYIQEMSNYCCYLHCNSKLIDQNIAITGNSA